MPTELPEIEPKVFPPVTTDQPLTALQEEILALKKERNAVILAHNYQIEPIQRIADYLGDSLGLAYAAMETDADVILFCGVPQCLHSRLHQLFGCREGAV
jgi:quinolinate synthase